MLRKIISAVVIVVALIALFFLIRAAVNAFSGSDEPEAPVQTEATVTDPAENPASERPEGSSTATPQSLPATNGGTTSGTSTTTGSAAAGSTAATPANPQLANAGPAETATAIVAITAALGTVHYVRRRQLADS